MLLLDLYLKGTIVKEESLLFSPWLLKVQFNELAIPQ